MWEDSCEVGKTLLTPASISKLSLAITDLFKNLIKDFPGELIPEVLVRLPIKPLVKCFLVLVSPSPLMVLLMILLASVLMLRPMTTRLFVVTPEHIEDAAKSALAEVYSLATGSWKSLGFVAPPCRVDGAIHWTVKHWEDADRFIILAFDTSSELFSEIMMPKDAEMHLATRVSVSGDGKSLALFTRHSDLSLDIWLMKEYGRQESWIKMITLSSQGLQKNARYRPMCFRKSGEVILVGNRKL